VAQTKSVVEINENPKNPGVRSLGRPRQLLSKKSVFKDNRFLLMSLKIPTLTGFEIQRYMCNNIANDFFKFYFLKLGATLFPVLWSN
jgi:hypothetical protein